MSKVTVILTTHNTEYSYFDSCLHSLSQQTFKDFDVYIIDDCSTEENFNLYSKAIDRYIEKGLNITMFIGNLENIGVGESVNFAFNKVFTEYVVRLGSDDLFATEMLQREVEFLDNNPSYIGVCCGLICFGTKEKIIRRPDVLTLKNCNIRTKAHAFGYGGGMMFRSSALNTCFIDKNLVMCEDFDFHLQLLRLGNIKGLEPMYLYRHHKNNLSKQIKTEKRLECLEYIYQKHEVGKDLVSILMPFYNTPIEYFRACLARIAKQSYKNFEIIMVDDGSSPRIDVEHLPEFRKLRRIIHLHRNEQNEGISNSLNTACKMAHGDYLLRIDSDDLPDEHLLEKEHDFLKGHEDYIACCCDLQMFGINDTLLQRPIEFNLDNVKDIKSAHGYGYGCSFMFKRKALEQCSFDPQFKVCEDFDFTLQLLRVGKIKGLEALYNYRQYSASTIKQYNREQRFELINRILRKHGRI